MIGLRLAPSFRSALFLAAASVFASARFVAAEPERLTSRTAATVSSSDLYDRSGDSEGTTTLKNHDDTFEGAYAWVFDSVVAPDYGAFAERFEGDVQLVEAQFFLTQIGNQDDGTLDVFVWEDNGVGRPGQVIAAFPCQISGQIATWPEVSLHRFPIQLDLSGKWWVGHWGSWPGENAEWFLAADENGPGGHPLTNIAPGIDYPSGWYHPDVVFGWQDCKSLGIQVTVDQVTPSSVDVGVGESSIAPRLERAFPNPFTESIQIEFRATAADPVVAEIVDTSGRRVRRLVDVPSDVVRRTVTWDGRDDGGHPVPGGVYYVRVSEAPGDPRAGGATATRLVLVR